MLSYKHNLLTRLSEYEFFFEYIQVPNEKHFT